MAQPSSERERDREKDRYRSSHHHHHRTISSTTLLLALSLILAVLAITLTIPSYSSSQSSEGSGGLLGYLGPKRTQGLLAREQAVAMREAEVARREAELLIGSPAGVAAPPGATIIPPGLPPSACAPATLSIVTQTVTLESYGVPTVVKEVVRELDAPATVVRYADPRVENLFEREHRVSDREREVSGREEVVGKREVDAARREQWIMDQLIKLGNDKVVEEEIVYDAPPRKKKESPVKPKKETFPQDSFPQDSFHNEPFHNTPPQPPQPIRDPAQPFEEPPQPFRVSVVDDPSETRLAAPPRPIVSMENKQPYVGKTQAYEVYVEQTPTGAAFAEPTFQAKPQVHAQVPPPQPKYDEVEEEEEEEEQPVKTIRRTKIPGIKHPSWKW